MNNQLISAAVARRLSEVRERVSSLDPQRFCEGGSYLSSIKELLRIEPAESRSRLAPFSDVREWAASDTDCITALCVLSLHGDKAMPVATYPPSQPFLDQLKSTFMGRGSSFDLLVERYSWPRNFSFMAEDAIREYILMRLMTADRARIEKGPAIYADADGLLLKLNLIAVHACSTTDLRFLDALNYYYELLPRGWQPRTQRGWLLATYFALYARALARWI